MEYARKESPRTVRNHDFNVEEGLEESKHAFSVKAFVFLKL